MRNTLLPLSLGMDSSSVREIQPSIYCWGRKKDNLSRFSVKERTSKRLHAQCRLHPMRFLKGCAQRSGHLHLLLLIMKTPLFPLDTELISCDKILTSFISFDCCRKQQVRLTDIRSKEGQCRGFCFFHFYSCPSCRKRFSPLVSNPGRKDRPCLKTSTP